MNRCAVPALLLAAAGVLTFWLAGPEEASAAKTRIRVPQDEPTLQAAVDAAGPGFTISLTPGNYSENVLISGKTDLRIDGRGSVLMGGGIGTALRIFDSTLITVTKLGFSNGSPYGLHVHGTSADILVSGCGFTADIVAGVLIDSPVTRVTIDKCAFIDLPGHGIRAMPGASEVRVTKNEFTNVVGIGVALGYEGGGSGVPNSVVEKNLLTGIGQHGIVFGGDGTLVAKNRVETVTGGNSWGIAVDDSTTTSGAVIEGNRVSDINGGGIRCMWNSGTVTKNRIEKTESYGILADGTGHVVTGNQVREARVAGVRLTGTGTTAESNKVRQGLDDGFQVVGASHEVLDNQSRGNNKYGYYVAGAGHTLTRNTAKGNGDWDLWDIGGLGASTYVRNRFPQEKFGP